MGRNMIIASFLFVTAIIHWNESITSMKLNKFYLFISRVLERSR